MPDAESITDVANRIAAMFRVPGAIIGHPYVEPPTEYVARFALMRMGVQFRMDGSIRVP